MTPREQKLAIAEAVGWTYKEAQNWKGKAWFDPYGQIGTEGLIPDYPSNLNAMHEAERMLSKEKVAGWGSYSAVLCAVVKSDVWSNAGLFKIINATAVQRAEAFLRTIGKWKD